MHYSNLPSTIVPLESPVRILTPLSGGPCICEVGHANTRLQGGMKGVMVSGDAHPYLAPLRENTEKPERNLGFLVGISPSLAIRTADISYRGR